MYDHDDYIELNIDHERWNQSFHRQIAQNNQHRPTSDDDDNNNSK